MINKLNSFQCTAYLFSDLDKIHFLFSTASLYLHVSIIKVHYCYLHRIILHEAALAFSKQHFLFHG